MPASLLTSVLVRRPRRHRGALALPRTGQRPELRDVPIAIVGLFVMPGRPHLVPGVWRNLRYPVFAEAEA